MISNDSFHLIGDSRYSIICKFIIYYVFLYTDKTSGYIIFGYDGKFDKQWVLDLTSLREIGLKILLSLLR